jgi:hypothetical protein
MMGSSVNVLRAERAEDSASGQLLRTACAPAEKGGTNHLHCTQRPGSGQQKVQSGKQTPISSQRTSHFSARRVTMNFGRGTFHWLAGKEAEWAANPLHPLLRPVEPPPPGASLDEILDHLQRQYPRRRDDDDEDEAE